VSGLFGPSGSGLAGGGNGGGGGSAQTVDWTGATETDPANAVTYSGAETVSVALNGTVHTCAAGTYASLQQAITALEPGQTLKAIITLSNTVGLATGHGIGIGIGTARTNIALVWAYLTGTGWSASTAQEGGNPPTADSGTKVAQPAKIVMIYTSVGDGTGRRGDFTVHLLDATDAVLVSYYINPLALAVSTDPDLIYLLSHDQTGNAASYDVSMTTEVIEAA
jgi:hypothetical protein